MSHHLILKMEKIKFYDNTLRVTIIAFVISFISVFLVPERFIENWVFVMPWLIVLMVGIVGETIFVIGMVYHSFKIKRYGWMFVIIILGTIFPIIFYITIMRDLFKKQ